MHTLIRTRERGLTILGALFALALILIIFAGMFYVAGRLISAMQRLFPPSKEKDEDEALWQVPETNADNSQPPRIVAGLEWTAESPVTNPVVTVESSTNLVDWIALTSYVYRGDWQWSLPIDTNKPQEFFRLKFDSQ